MITSNVIHRVYHIKYKNGTGTAFQIDIDGKQYFVTAKHVIEGIADQGYIELRFKQNWSSTQINLIGHHVKSDVSVFSINQTIACTPMDAKSTKVFYGQDVYFLGFPYQLQFGESNTVINNGFPAPLVKKAIISGFMPDYYLLDGMNNHGFSGGPVVYKPPGQSDFEVAAVISGYLPYTDSVKSPVGPTGLTYDTNTGLIIAYRIEDAIDLIRANPNGAVIKSS
jgi:hypothetical protein